MGEIVAFPSQRIRATPSTDCARFLQAWKSMGKPDPDQRIDKEFGDHIMLVWGPAPFTNQLLIAGFVGNDVVIFFENNRQKFSTTITEFIANM